MGEREPGRRGACGGLSELSNPDVENAAESLRHVPEILNRVGGGLDNGNYSTRMKPWPGVRPL